MEPFDSSDETEESTRAKTSSRATSHITLPTVLTLKIRSQRERLMFLNEALDELTTEHTNICLEELNALAAHVEDTHTAFLKLMLSESGQSHSPITSISPHQFSAIAVKHNHHLKDMLRG